MSSTPFTAAPAVPGDNPPRLSTDRCLELLRGAMAGHLALSQGALPLVLPVTCALDGDHLLMARAGSGHLAWALSHPGIVAFQTAATSLDGRWRFEVLVRGPATIVGDALLTDQTPPPLPLVATDKTVVLRISMELITGWQYNSSPAKA